MRILLTGGTGLIGTLVAQALIDRGDQVFCYTRKARAQRPNLVWLTGPADDPATYAQAMGLCEGVINLAGAPIACRWTERNRALIKDSRILTTRALVQAARQSEKKPQAWVNASAVGFYGAKPRGLCDESAAQGSGFLAEVSALWEQEACKVEALGVRLVRLRLGAVLAVHGGMLPLFVTAAKAFVGGPMGSGSQPLSWIHISDAVRMLLWCLDGGCAHEAQVVNAVAPNAAQQGELIHHIGQILRRPMWLRSPPWALQLALGAMANELILGGQEVVPKTALQHGFSWQYPHLEGALNHLLRRP